MMVRTIAEPAKWERSQTFAGCIPCTEEAGGTFSNIHNRIGEAEKSHQKARAAGYVECWTVVNVDRFDEKMAQRESPSTDRFYRISDLTKRKGDAYSDFRNRIISLAGIVDESDGA